MTIPILIHSDNDEFGDRVLCFLGEFLVTDNRVFNGLLGRTAKLRQPNVARV